MAQVIVVQRMWQRRDTPENWTARNPVLADGEIGIERDVPTTYFKMKIGDGSTPWNDLDYFGGEGGTVSMRVDSGYIQYSNDDGDTWNNLIAVADLEGPPGPEGDPGPAGDDGREVELQAGATHIQWRYVGDPTWTDLIAIEDIEGPPGDPGAQGPPGGPTEVISTSGNITLNANDHKGRFLLHTSGAITCPATVAAGFAKDDIVEVRRQSGAVTFVAGAGATLDYDTSRFSAAIYSLKDVVALKVIATNTWAIIGPLADA